MRRRRLFWLLLVRWGFAVLVAVAIAIGLLVALTVAPPPDVPAVALQAPIIYRVEVGAAVFLGLYLATMAFALALQNRASPRSAPAVSGRASCPRRRNTRPLSRPRWS
jgi:hypothetical protein